MQSDAIRRYFDKSCCFGNDRFRALRARIQNVRRIANSNSTKDSHVYKISHCKNCFTVTIKLPIVSCDVDLISGAAPQIFESILLCRRTDLNGFPIAELRFVVDRIAMNRCIVGGMRPQLHGQRVGGGSGKSDLWRVRRSYENNVNFKIF